MIKPRFLLGAFIVMLLISSARCWGAPSTADPFSLDGCSFDIEDMAGGHYDFTWGHSVVTGNYSYVDSPEDDPYTGATFFCGTRWRKDPITAFLGAREINGRWIAADTGEPLDAARNITSYFLSGSNWVGYGYAIDDNGYEMDRMFKFCLHEQIWHQTLCISAPLLRQNANQLNDLLTVIKSIKFKKPLE